MKNIKVLCRAARLSLAKNVPFSCSIRFIHCIFKFIFFHQLWGNNLKVHGEKSKIIAALKRYFIIVLTLNVRLHVGNSAYKGRK